MFKKFSVLAQELKRISSLGDAFHCIDRQLDTHGVVRNEYVWKALSFFTSEKSHTPPNQTESFALRLLHCCSPLEFNESPARRVLQAQSVWNVITSDSAMPKRLNLYNALLQSFVSNFHQFDPVEYLGLIQKAGLVPDQTTLACVVEAYSKAGNMDSVKQILDHMRAERIQVTSQALNALIVAYIKERNEKEADSVLEMMRSSPQPPSESTFLVMLHAYASVPGGDLPRALERVRNVLRDAREFGVVLPPMRVFGSLVPFCAAGYEPHSTHLLNTLHAELRVAREHDVVLESKAARFVCHELIASGFALCAARLHRLIVMPSISDSLLSDVLDDPVDITASATSQEHYDPRQYYAIESLLIALLTRRTDPRKLREFYYALTWIGPQPEAWTSKRPASVRSPLANASALNEPLTSSPLPLASIDAPPFALTRAKYTQLLASALEEINAHAPDLTDPIFTKSVWKLFEKPTFPEYATWRRSFPVLEHKP